MADNWPTLADMVFATLRAKPLDLVPKILHRMPNILARTNILRIELERSRRFVFDRHFTRAVVESSSVYSETILRRAPLARLPFGSVWIEFPARERMRAQYDLKTMGNMEKVDPTFPDHPEGMTSGYLLQKIETYEDSENSWIATQYIGDLADKGPPILSPVSNVFGDDLWKYYSANQWIESHQREIASTWGYADTDGKTVVSEALFRRGWAVPEFRIWSLTMNEETPIEDARVFDNVWRIQARESRGDMRFLISALAMLNSPMVAYQHRAPSGKYQKRLRNFPFLDNRIVSLKPLKFRVHQILDRMTRDRETLTRHRRHEVRGFWRRVEMTGSKLYCQHEIIDSDLTHALCGKCKCLLRWIPDHMRGDSTLGYVNHTYQVSGKQT